MTMSDVDLNGGKTASESVDCAQLRLCEKNHGPGKHRKSPMEAFSREKNTKNGEESPRNGHVRTALKNNSNNKTEVSRKVHFKPDHLSPVYELKPYSIEAESTSTNSNIYVLIAVFALAVATVAVVGCVMLYMMTTALREDLNNLEARVFGASPTMGSNNGGLSKYFSDKVASVQDEVGLLQRWANHSACVPGHDFTSGGFCFRLQRFELDFWQAADFCAARNGHLGFAHDLESWNKTVAFLLDRGFRMKEVWTGVYKDGQGVWRYSNGRVATFTRWARGNIFDEGDDCSQIRIDPVYSRIGMYDRRCSINARPFLCRFKVK